MKAFESTWNSLENLGLVSVKPNRINLTYTGKLFADEIDQSLVSTVIQKFNN